MHIRCPYCHRHVEIVDEAGRENVACPSCGSRFSLLSSDATVGQPINRARRVWSWCRRNPAVSSLAATVALALATGTGVSAYFAVQAVRRADLAEMHLQAAKSALSEAIAARENEARAAERSASAASQSQTREGEQRQAARNEERRAKNLRLVEQARAALDPYPERAMLLAIEAVESSKRHGEPVEPAAEQTLRDVLAAVGGRPLAASSPVVSVARFSPDGRELVTAAPDASVARWDISLSEPLLLRTEGRARGAAGPFPRPYALSPDARWLVVSGGDGSAHVCDLSAADPLAAVMKLPPEHKITVDADSAEYLGTIHFVFSPNGRRLAALGASTAPTVVWDLASPRPDASATRLRAINRANEPWTANPWSAAAFSADGRWLAATGPSAKAELGKEPTVRIWDMRLDNPDTSAIDVPTAWNPLGIRFSDDGRWFATVGRSGDEQPVRLFSSASQRPFAQVTLKGQPPAPTSCFDLSRDGRWLAVDGGDVAVRVWRLDSAPNIESTALAHGGKVHCIAFSPDSKRLVTGDQKGVVRIWQLDGAPRPAPLVLPTQGLPIKRVWTSRDGRWLVAAAEEGAPVLWDLSLPDPGVSMAVLRGHDVGVDRVEFSGDGRHLLTLGTRAFHRAVSLGKPLSPRARVWNLPIAAQPAIDPLTLVAPDAHDLRGRSTPSALSPAADGVAIATSLMSEDGRWLAALVRPRRAPDSPTWSGTAEYKACVWDVRNLEATREPWLITQPYACSLAFSHDGRRLLIGSSADTAALVELPLGGTPTSAAERQALVRRLRGSNGWFSEVAFTDDDRFALGFNHRTYRLWEIGRPESPPTTATINGLGLLAAATSDKRWLATYSDDGEAVVWELAATLAPISKVQIRQPSEPPESVGDLCISPDGKWLVALWANKVDLWPIDAARRGQTPTATAAYGVSRGFSSAEFSSDGNWLAIAGFDGLLWLWRFRDGQPDTAPKSVAAHPPNVVEQILFSRDGRRLLTRGHGAVKREAASPPGGDFQQQLPVGLRHSVKLWKLDAKDPFAAPREVTLPDDAGPMLACSPDGSRLAIAGGGRPVRVWNLASVDPNPSPIALPLSGDDLDWLRFSGDGRWLVGKGRDGLRLWRATLHDLVESARRAVGRELTDDERKNHLALEAPQAGL